LKAAPLHRHYEAQRDQIEAIVSELGELDDTFFTREEAEQLKQRLDDLEAQLAANIRGAVDEEGLQEIELTSLHDEIEDLKNKTVTRTKSGWARSLARRFCSVVGRSRQPENAWHGRAGRKGTPTRSRKKHDRWGLGTPVSIFMSPATAPTKKKLPVSKKRRRFLHAFLGPIRWINYCRCMQLHFQKTRQSLIFFLPI